MNPILELTGISKDFHALRPLRIAELVVSTTDRLAILGMDALSSEVLINLITGVSLPNDGRITAFGRITSDIRDGAEWLSALDHFGIVTARAVLLDGLTVLQNLCVPFTLDIEPPSEEVRERAQRLAGEAGIPSSVLDVSVAMTDEGMRARIRLARALALEPRLLLLDHASAGLQPAVAAQFGRDARTVATDRHIALLAMTTDERFARSVAERVLVWDPATGGMASRRR